MITRAKAAPGQSRSTDRSATRATHLAQFKANHPITVFLGAGVEADSKRWKLCRQALLANLSVNFAGKLCRRTSSANFVGELRRRTSSANFVGELRRRNSSANLVYKLDGDLIGN
ncbi:hypothetical protein [Streptomyces sp. enrichment culture]|uniref:hypothetical protein n=1 Tax=Streptomyces sp. enrichment culture TaxID=1795815 RepID=UPI003F56D35D